MTIEKLQLDLFGDVKTITPLRSKPTEHQKKILSQCDLLADRSPPPVGAPIIVSYGAGTNSTAMLIAMHLKGITPDEVIFADTGNEKPETYEFIDRFNSWLKSVNFPAITVVRYEIKTTKPRNKIFKKFSAKKWKTLKLATLDASTKAWFNHLQQNWKYSTLGEECLILEGLPSKAYGNGACSAKWKVEVIQKHVKTKHQKQVRQFVGIHAGEKSRLLMSDGSPKKLETEDFYNEYPLIEWNLDQQNCNALCLWALNEVPPKSSCWFCPNAKLSEVKELRDNRPDFFELGCLIEGLGMAYVKSQSIKGLGRSFSWRNLDNLTPIEIAAIESEKAGRRCNCTD